MSVKFTLGADPELFLKSKYIGAYNIRKNGEKEARNTTG